MQTLVYCIATRRWDGWLDCVKTWRENASRKYPEFIVYDKNVLEAYQELWLQSQDFEYSDPILFFGHDDLIISEKDRDLRVLKEFEDPTVGMVGFAGATRHGAADLYTSPYKLQNLGRSGFASNLRDAEVHGARFAGEKDCAVYDGMALFIRRSILDKIGGWPAKATYFLYTEAICCEARKQGYRLRLVGVKCDHLGGKTSTMVNITDSHEASHSWLFHRYRQNLPFSVEGK